jgi:SAM-dependent methyltransferase
MSDQKSAFIGGEADNWFRRNEGALGSGDAMHRAIVEHVARHLEKTTTRVLEVGCANGHNLASLARYGAVEGLGLDPSTHAVASGLETWPTLDLRVGTADCLPTGDGQVDMLWYGFCLYLIDRPLLFRVVAEADRVLRDGGTLVIHDFDPGTPRARKYVHREGVWSYKMDYSALFLANPEYNLIEKWSFSHAGPRWDCDPEERLGLWILKKSRSRAYVAT